MPDTGTWLGVETRRRDRGAQLRPQGAAGQAGADRGRRGAQGLPPATRPSAPSVTPLSISMPKAGIAAPFLLNAQILFLFAIVKQRGEGGIFLTGRTTKIKGKEHRPFS